MKLWKELSPYEEADFRAFARRTYKPCKDINGVWHPVVQDECVKMNKEWNIGTVDDLIKELKLTPEEKDKSNA